MKTAAGIKPLGTKQIKNRTAVLAAASLLSSSLMLGTVAAQAAPACHDLLKTAEEPVKPEGALYQARLAANGSPIVFRMGEGRLIHSQIIAPQNPERPTLLLMPGSNRSFTSEDLGVRQLVAQGFGVATLNLSAQPFSIAALPGVERPAFFKNEPTLQDFAAEAQFLAERLRADYGIQNIIPVSLSYSGAISPFLKGFPVIVETAPMTSTAASNPVLANYYQSLKLAASFNPIFGPAIMRNSLDTSYRQVWIGQVKEIIDQFGLPQGRSSDMVEGYVRLSRASEEFAWGNPHISSAIARDTRRVFIVGKDEAPLLLKNQIETFKQMRSIRNDTLLFIIEDAGHVIPEMQPAAYAAVFEALSAKYLEDQSGIVIISPATGRSEFKTGPEADAIIEAMLR